MNKVLLLTKVLRKCSKGDNAGNNSKTVDAQLPLLITFAIAGAVGLFFLGQLCATSAEFIGFDSSVICSFIYFAAGIAVFGWSLFRFVNKLFMGNDLQIITTMPFSSSQIAIVKLIDTAVFMYGLAGIIIVPFSIGYGMESASPFGFYLSSLVALLIVPMFSLCVAGSIVILFFSIFRFARNKDIITFIGIGFTLVLMIGILLIQSKDRSADELKNTLAVLINTASSVGRVIPVVPFLSDFTKDFNVISLLIALLITIGSFLLYFVISKLLYLKSALSMTNTSANGKRLGGEDIKKIAKKTNAIKSYAKKDFLVVRRTPAYLMNSFIIPYIWPILIAMPIFFSESSSEDGGIFNNIQNIEPNDFLMFSVMLPIAIAFFSAFFACGLSLIAVTSISREGKSFLYMKFLPMSYKDQIKAKRNTALAGVIIPSTGYTLILLVVACVLKMVAWWSIIVGVLFSLCLLVICTDFAIISSAKRANISWENETDITRGGLISGIYVGVGLVGTMLLCVGIAVASSLFADAFLIISIAISTVFVILSAIIAYIVEKRMYKKTTEILNEM